MWEQRILLSASDYRAVEPKTIGQTIAILHRESWSIASMVPPGMLIGDFIERLSDWAFLNNSIGTPAYIAARYLSSVNTAEDHNYTPIPPVPEHIKVIAHTLNVVDIVAGLIFLYAGSTGIIHLLRMIGINIPTIWETIFKLF